MKSSQHLHPLHHSCCASLFHCASHASTTRCLEIGFSRKQVLVILVPRTVVGINASSGASIGKGKHLPRPGKFLFRGGYDQLVPAKGWVLKEFDPSSNFLTKALARESVAFSFPGSVARWRCVRIEGRTLVQGCRWAHSVAEEAALSGKSLSQLYGAVRHRGVTLC